MWEVEVIAHSNSIFGGITTYEASRHARPRAFLATVLSLLALAFALTGPFSFGVR